MALEAYMYFKMYSNNKAGASSGGYMLSESQVDMQATSSDIAELVNPFKTAKDNKGLFEVEDYSFDIEQVLSIGSQTSGSGAGKVTFNPFSITRKIDKSSPLFYQFGCAGTPFSDVGLGLRKSAGTDSAGVLYLAFTFKLVAVKTWAIAHDDEAPKETVTFEYGGLVVQYCQQNPDGSLQAAITKGWNRVTNKSIDATASLTDKG